MEQLPDYFDVIVIGTGMPECIIAAAAARVGKTVLHLERTYVLLDIEVNEGTGTSCIMFSKGIQQLSLGVGHILNVLEGPQRNGYYGGDWASFSFDKFLEWIEDTKDTPESSENNISGDQSLQSFLNENERLALCQLKSKTISNIAVRSFVNETADQLVPTNVEPASSLHNSSVPEASEEAAEPVPNNENGSDESSEVSAESNLTVENSVPSNSSTSMPLHLEWTISQFIENRRKFNIDLAPKIMFSRGSLVELLISSNIARYAEFQCVNRVLTCINDHIEQVPCSRADVFSTKNVTVVEKRMLMKFLTFCLKYSEHEEEYKGFENSSFLQFLRSKKLTRNVEHYILNAIAMVDENCNTIEGLKSTQKFLQSLGRYGKSPFLCTCYGSAELPQCFCRLCAVYGGLYYLKRSIEAIVLSERCCGIVSMNQRINCQWLVTESSYCPPEFLPSNICSRISKGIFITDESLYPAQKKENVLLKLPPGSTNSSAITILEFSSKTYVCPEDLYIVYMYCRSINSTAEEDLMPVADIFFRKPSSLGSPCEVTIEKESSVSKKPNLLWCTFFNQLDTSTVDLNSNVPEGLFVTSSPDVDLDYEHAVKEAQEIFERMCPGEEFLPRAPDPEDILIERHNSAGDEGEKIENDVSQPEDESTDDTTTPVNSENEPSATSEDKIQSDE